jgi:hypothetical protein
MFASLFGHHPLHARLPADVMTGLALAGFSRTGEHNQRQSFFRFWNRKKEEGAQHIEIVENAPGKMVVIYESANGQGDPLEERRQVAGATLEDAINGAVSLANDSCTVYYLSGPKALRG